MTPIEMISSGIPTVVVPVDPGVAVLSLLATLVLSIGILSLAGGGAKKRTQHGAVAAA